MAKLSTQQQDQLDKLFNETIVMSLYEDMNLSNDQEAQLAIDYLIIRLKNLTTDNIIQD